MNKDAWIEIAIEQTQKAIIRAKKGYLISAHTSECAVCAFVTKTYNITPTRPYTTKPCHNSRRFCPALAMCRDFSRIAYHNNSGQKTQRYINGKLKDHLSELNRLKTIRRDL